MVRPICKHLEGCSIPNLAEFYANYEVTNGVVTSMVNGKQLRFNAKELGKILRIPSKGFGVYVREDKTVLGTARLLQLTQRLSQQPGLKTPPSVKKGEMTTSPVDLLVRHQKYHPPGTRPQSCGCNGSVPYGSSRSGGTDQPTGHHDQSSLPHSKHVLGNTT